MDGDFEREFFRGVSGVWRFEAKLQVMQSRTFWFSLAFAILAFVGRAKALTRHHTFSHAQLPVSQKLLRDITPFPTHNCRSHQNKIPPATGEILHWIEGSDQLRSTLRQPQNTSIMDSHGNLDHSGRFFASEEYQKLAERLQSLHTTIKDMPMVREHDIVAFDRSEARFMQDALVIEEQLAAARARFDASFRGRRPPEITFISMENDGSERLSRTRQGNVWGPAYGPIRIAVMTRLAFLFWMSVAGLLWHTVAYISSWFGQYEVHVKWTLIGYPPWSQQVGGWSTIFRLPHICSRANLYFEIPL